MLFNFYVMHAIHFIIFLSHSLHYLDKTSSRSLELLSAEHSHSASALDKGFSCSFSFASFVGPMLPSIAINMPSKGGGGERIE